MEVEKNWSSLGWINIRKIEDSEKRDYYYQQYFQYIYNISRYIIDELSRRGLFFEYSGSMNVMTIQEMYNELCDFCEANGMSEEEQVKIVLKGYAQELFQKGNILKAKEICEQHDIPFDQVRSKKK